MYSVGQTVVCSSLNIDRESRGSEESKHGEVLETAQTVAHSNEVCTVIVFTIYALLLVVRFVWSGQCIGKYVVHTLDFASNLL